MPVASAGLPVGMVLWWYAVYLAFLVYGAARNVQIFNISSQIFNNDISQLHVSI